MLVPVPTSLLPNELYSSRWMLFVSSVLSYPVDNLLTIHSRPRQLDSLCQLRVFDVGNRPEEIDIVHNADGSPTHDDASTKQSSGELRRTWGGRIEGR